LNDRTHGSTGFTNSDVKSGVQKIFTEGQGIPRYTAPAQESPVTDREISEVKQLTTGEVMEEEFEKLTRELKSLVKEGRERNSAHIKRGDPLQKAIMAILLGHDKSFTLIELNELINELVRDKPGNDIRNPFSKIMKSPVSKLFYKPAKKRPITIRVAHPLVSLLDAGELYRILLNGSEAVLYSYILDKCPELMDIVSPNKSAKKSSTAETKPPEPDDSDSTSEAPPSSSIDVGEVEKEAMSDAEIDEFTKSLNWLLKASKRIEGMDFSFSLKKD